MFKVIKLKHCSNCDREHTRPGPRCGRCSSYLRRYGVEHPGIDLFIGSEPCPSNCRCGRHKYYGGARKCKPGCICKRHNAPGRPSKTYFPRNRFDLHRGYRQATKIFRLPRYCQIRGCIKRAVERHHIDGDATNSVPENLVGLCLSHHKEVHRGIVNTAYLRKKKGGDANE